MDDIVDKLKDAYIDRLTKEFSVERTMVYLIFLFGNIYLSLDLNIGFINFVSEIKIQDIFDFSKVPASEVTLGFVISSFIFACLTTLAYNRLIKKICFTYLSKTKGFEGKIKTWIDRTMVSRSSDARLNTTVADDIRKKINSKILKIIQLHSIGEVLFSLSLVLAFALNDLNWLDFAFFVLSVLLIIWIQRHAYIYYLSEVLPRMVTEKIFLEKEFEHEKAFLDMV